MFVKGRGLYHDNRSVKSINFPMADVARQPDGPTLLSIVSLAFWDRLFSVPILLGQRSDNDDDNDYDDATVFFMGKKVLKAKKWRYAFFPGPWQNNASGTPFSSAS